MELWLPMESLSELIFLKDYPLALISPCQCAIAQTGFNVLGNSGTYALLSLQ